MADSREIPNNSRPTGENNTNNDDSDSEELVQPLVLDLGDDSTRPTDSHRLGFQSAGTSGASEAPRREDNPFSFKHFIRSDINYQSKGARPKVYCDGRPVASISDLECSTQEPKQTRVEYSSALPDFVQDHLVIEQCYLGHPTSSFNVDVNLPDFTPSRDSVDINRINLDSSHNVSPRCESSNNVIPLDLPVRPSTGFPLDLPIHNQFQSTSRNCLNSEVGVSKSLPDFLTDGAVRSQDTDAPAESPEREYDRLQRELEFLRGQLTEQTRCVETLNRELEIARNKEHDYTQHLAKALEQVEKNLERSNMRTTSAENTILKLKQEIKSLMAEVAVLKSENLQLRGEAEGAAGGQDYYTPSELHSQRLAQELKAAASTAEHSLRQLLTGVDNLRIMAASLENMHRIEEKRESFLDLDDDSGPAL